MFKKKIKLKIEKVFPIKVYFHTENKLVIAPEGQADRIIIADRDQHLTPPKDNIMPDNIEVRFADLIVYEKTKIEG